MLAANPPAPTSTHGRRWVALACTAAVAACALFYSAWLPRRPFTDEGSVCTLAQGLLRGQTLYRDLANEKAPGQYALTALFLAAFGQGMPVVRLVPAVSLLAALLLGGRLAAALAGSRRAGVVAAAAMLLAAPAYQAFNDVAETSLAPIALLAATVALAPPAWLAGRRWRFLLLGALLGLGLWFKQNFVWGAAGFLVAPVLAGRRVGVAAGAALAWSIGFAVAWLHSGPSLLAVTMRGAAGVVLAEATGYARWPTPIDAIVMVAHLVVLGSAMLAARADRSGGVTSLAVVAAALGLMAVPRMDVFRLWPAAVLLAVASAVLVVRGERRRQRAVLAVLLGGWTGGCAIARTPGAAPTFAALAEISTAVARLTGPADTIWVGPHEPNVYCLSGRAPAARHTFVLPWYPAPAQRDELLAALRRSPPRVVVDVGGRPGGSGLTLAELLPGLRDVLAERYQRHTVVAGAVIYLRR